MVFSMRKFIPPFVALLLAVSLFLMPINAYAGLNKWSVSNSSTGSYNLTTGSGYVNITATGSPGNINGTYYYNLISEYNPTRVYPNSTTIDFVIGQEYTVTFTVSINLGNRFINEYSSSCPLSIYYVEWGSSRKLDTLFYNSDIRSFVKNNVYDFTLSTSFVAQTDDPNFVIDCSPYTTYSTGWNSNTIFIVSLGDITISPTSPLAGDGANWSGNTPTIPNDGSDEILGSISGDVDNIDKLLSNSNDFVSSLTSSFSFISSTINRFWTDSDLTPVVVLVLSLGLAFYVIGKRVSSS